MSIDFNNFQQAFQWVSTHSYVVIFLVMCVEGPIATAAAGFAAALGILNPAIVFGISVMGDLIPDSIYYLIGYKSRLSSIEKIMHKMGLTHSRMERMENMLRKHFRKTLIAVKFTPFIGPFGYMLIGYLRFSFTSFILVCSAVTIPKSIIFLAFGYYFGQLYNINEYIQNISFFAPLVVALLFLLYFGYMKISKIISRGFGGI